MSTEYLNDLSKEQEFSFRNILRAALLATPLGIYISKYCFFSLGHQGDLGFLWVCALPILVIPLLVGGVIGLCIAIFSATLRDCIPLLLFAPLIILGFIFTLLPLPANQAEGHFYQHRAQYEAIVETARNGQFIGKMTPEAATFYAEVLQTDLLVMSFNPQDDFYNYVAYAEKVEDLRVVSACYSDGGVISQLADHWWLCFREWN
ncbi:MAG: hypothetical protein KF726_03410 [Anaerolineae bacterium]|nr:hypothetical protein [Anaerolineae bacterium]